MYSYSNSPPYTCAPHTIYTTHHDSFLLPHAGQSHFYAVLMMPLSLCFVVYAVRTYLWRSDKIHTRDVERLVGGDLLLVLFFMLFFTVVRQSVIH